LWATAAVFALATLVLCFISPQGWRHFKEHPQLWWLMAASGLTNIGFNWAVTTGDVVRVVLLFYLMPTWALLLAWWMLGERPTRGALMRLSLALLGVVLVLKTPESPWPLPQDLPDVLALLAGFTHQYLAAAFAAHARVVTHGCHVWRWCFDGHGVRCCCHLRRCDPCGGGGVAEWL
jgi:drug/metabolite transporter (DMT)-like permease